MKKILTSFIFLFSFLAIAQEKEKDKSLPKGNEAFAEKRYADAEADYRISQAKFSKKAVGSYNLGNSIYRQKQIAESKYHYAKAIQSAKTKTEKHRAFHNLGNCLFTEKEYGGAVEAYKNALRNNPNDEETRYNYALAKEYLKNNPPKKDDDKNKDKDQKKKDDQKEKNDDKKDDKDKKDNKDKQDDKKDGKNDKDNKDNKDNNQGKPQPQPGGISKERLQNLLDAVQNEEKKVQDKVNKQKVKANPNKPEKDW